MYYIVLFHFPTGVYSCCVRHEENRSENCCIVFPHIILPILGVMILDLLLITYIEPLSTFLPALLGY